MSGRDLVWRGSKLYFGKRVVGEIVPDGTYPTMWRIVRPDGSLSDMVNRTRAKDACEAAFTTTARRGRGRQSLSEASPVAANAVPAIKAPHVAGISTA
jgi:hypothetical protein